MTHRPYPAYKDSGIEWLGEVPEHWEVVSFRRVVDIAEGQVDPEVEPYSSMNLIAPNHIESGTGRLVGMETAAEQSAESGKYLCKTGEVIYSKIRPALRKACIAPVDCLCSADMYPLSGRHDLSNGYLLWTILSEEFSAYTILESDRVAMPKINRDSLNGMRLLLPPLPEQQTIAAFLDRETAKIDGLVVEQERLIELLTEKRQAVISHAVTRGLDPSAPLKDSGVEWLGQIPEHWKVKKLRFLCEVQTGDKDTINAKEDGEYPFFVRSQTVEKIDSYSFDGEAVLTAGDGVGVGKVFHHFQGKFDFHQRVYMMSHFRNVTGRFFFHYLSSMFHKVALDGGAKSTVDSLRRPLFMGFQVTIPPLVEQCQIVEFIELELQRFDALIAEARRGIDLLKERRTALISAAVTGKIDVREAA